MRTRLLAALLMGLLAGVVLQAPFAVAAPPKTYVRPAGHQTVIHLPASNGYRIVIYTEGPYVSLEVLGPGVDNYYSVKSRHSGIRGLEADLPGYGAVNVRFVPTGPKRRLHRNPTCSGPGATVQRGVVRGTIAFVAEGGFTEAQTDHASAEVFTWTRQECRYRKRHRHKQRISASFEAASNGNEEASFEATRFVSGLRPPDRQVVFSASSGGSIAGGFVSRSVSAVAEVSSFLFPDGTRNPEHVIFEPPSPFTGSGTLQRTHESTYTWEGSLSVRFPGLPSAVPLTGPQFRLSFCALRGCIGQSTPEEEREEEGFIASGPGRAQQRPSTRESSRP